MDINLNADLGESFGAYRMGDDAALMAIIGSANVARQFIVPQPHRAAAKALQIGKRRVRTDADASGLRDAVGARAVVAVAHENASGCGKERLDRAARALLRGAFPGCGGRRSSHGVNASSKCERSLT